MHYPAGEGNDQPQSEPTYVISKSCARMRLLLIIRDVLTGRMMEQIDFIEDKIAPDFYL
ncbi:MAG: hypothetical protein V1709_01130 [Planctomycetota bacterium]